MMCTFIGIESLAANALIEIMENSEKREVSFETLVKYGMKIVKVLQEQAGDEAVLLLSEKYQLSMVDNYSYFFDVDFNGPGQNVFRLKDDVTVDELSSYFRWTMSTKIIKAFMAEEARMELGLAA